MRSPRDLPVATVDGEAVLEDYLDHLCAPLVGVMSYTDRQAVRREIGGHLRTLAAAREELGATPQVALVDALRQFGRPQAIGSAIRREHAIAAGMRPGAVAATAAATALVAMVGAVVVSLATSSEVVAMVQYPWAVRRIALWLLVGAIPYGLVGGVIGLLASRRNLTAGKATLLGALLASLGFAAVVGASYGQSGYPWHAHVVVHIAYGLAVLRAGVLGALCGGLARSLIARWLGRGPFQSECGGSAPGCAPDQSGLPNQSCGLWGR